MEGAHKFSLCYADFYAFHMWLWLFHNDFVFLQEMVEMVSAEEREMAAEMAANFLNEERSESIFGAPKAGPGMWASIIRIINPISGNTLEKIQLEQNESVHRWVKINCLWIMNQHVCLFSQNVMKMMSFPCFNWLVITIYIFLIHDCSGWYAVLRNIHIYGIDYVCDIEYICFQYCLVEVCQSRGWSVCVGGRCQRLSVKSTIFNWRIFISLSTGGWRRKSETTTQNSCRGCAWCNCILPRSCSDRSGKIPTNIWYRKEENVEKMWK